LDTGFTPHVDLPSPFVIVDYTGEDACCQNHGNHVMGTAGASDNEFGVIGICRSDFHIYRVLGQNGSGSSTRISQAIMDAADDGMEIISMSLGGPTAMSTMREALDYAISKGVIVIAAAGNEGERGMIFPGAWEDIISVFAIDEQSNVASFSSRGKGSVSSGGVRVLSTIENNEYGIQSGTSMSTPSIAGVAAIIKEYYKEVHGVNLNQASMKNILEQSCDDIDSPGRDERTGYGVPNLKNVILKSKGVIDEPIVEPDIENPVPAPGVKNSLLTLLIIIGAAVLFVFFLSKLSSNSKQ